MPDVRRQSHNRRLRHWKVFRHLMPIAENDRSGPCRTLECLMLYTAGTELNLQLTQGSSSAFTHSDSSGRPLQDIWHPDPSLPFSCQRFPSINCTPYSFLFFLIFNQRRSIWVCKLSATYSTSCPPKTQFLHTEPSEGALQLIHPTSGCFLSCVLH